MSDTPKAKFLITTILSSFCDNKTRIRFNQAKMRDSHHLKLAYVLVLYAGMFEGILPNQPGISWESHLFGGLIGIFTAYFYKEDLLEEVEREKNLNATRTWADEFEAQDTGTQYFLPRDIFEKTKEERRRESEDYYD